MRKAIALTVGFFVVGNCLLFLVYRVVFLWCFAESPHLSESFQTMLYGLRLDCSLLGFELFGVGLISILLLRVRLNWVSHFLWSLTYLHMLTCLANVLCFEERNQQMGELLLAYITEPYQIYLAVLPFVQSHPVFVALLVFGSFALLYSGFWFGGRLRRYSMSLLEWRNGIVWVLVVVCFPSLWTLQPVLVKKTKRPSGWKLYISQSKYYMRSSSFTQNQAVVNPCYDIFRIHIPAAFKATSTYRYRMTEEQALSICRPLLGLQAGNARYPLLTRIHSDVDLGIQNVILLEVEGLSRDVFDLDVDGKPVMPFLRRLSREGLYFPNTFQSFNATAGSVFSAATSFHKCCFEETTDRFADYEANCCYGSLSRVLGNADYTHYFCEGFRQCATDFTAFMANQGYSTYNYHDFERRLKAKNLLDETDNALGVFDGGFFQECAEIISACPTKFTLHVMTTTSHSPWEVPRSFSQRFTSPSANAFAYVDASIELLFETLKKNLPTFDQTLFVIVADHTSITTNDNLINRIRIPLIFYNAKFAGKVERWENIQSSYASHVDILPTVLGFLGGDHDYSGMGRNLLTANESHRGVISGNNYTGLYLKGNFCLQYNQPDRETKLLLIDHDQIPLNDVSIEYPEVFSQMQQEYWAQYELAKRLAAEKRVYPPKKGD